MLEAHYFENRMSAKAVNLYYSRNKTSQKIAFKLLTDYSFQERKINISELYINENPQYLTIYYTLDTLLHHYCFMQ